MMLGRRMPHIHIQHRLLGHEFASRISCHLQALTRREALKLVGTLIFVVLWAVPHGPSCRKPSIALVEAIEPQGSEWVRLLPNSDPNDPSPIFKMVVLQSI